MKLSLNSVLVLALGAAVLCGCQPKAQAKPDPVKPKEPELARIDGVEPGVLYALIGGAETRIADGVTAFWISEDKQTLYFASQAKGGPWSLSRAAYADGDPVMIFEDKAEPFSLHEMKSATGKIALIVSMRDAEQPILGIADPEKGRVFRQPMASYVAGSEPGTIVITGFADASQIDLNKPETPEGQTLDLDEILTRKASQKPESGDTH